MKEKKGKNKIRTFIIVLFLIGLGCTIILFGINAYVKASVKRLILTEEEAIQLDEIDCILVLGAGVWEGNRPSAMLEDRLNQAISLYKAGAADKLLMSGDHGRKDYDEVNVMKQYAIDTGVPSEDIFMDHAGFSTYESLYRAKEIFQGNKVIVVTQRYHLHRALYVGKGLGLEVYGVPSDPREYVGQSKRELREIAARIKDFLYVITKPEPTYLGETIPVTGDGNITND